jgi:hypothetical protein
MTRQKPTWTYDLAVAASWDAATRSMRKAGRTAWSEDDFNLAVDTFNRLYPERIPQTGATP